MKSNNAKITVLKKSKQDYESQIAILTQNLEIFNQKASNLETNINNLSIQSNNLKEIHESHISSLAETFNSKKAAFEQSIRDTMAQEHKSQEKIWMDQTQDIVNKLKDKYNKQK